MLILSWFHENSRIVPLPTKINHIRCAFLLFVLRAGCNTILIISTINVSDQSTSLYSSMWWLLYALEFGARKNGEEWINFLCTRVLNFDALESCKINLDHPSRPRLLAVAFLNSRIKVTIDMKRMRLQFGIKSINHQEHIYFYESKYDLIRQTTLLIFFSIITIIYNQRGANYFLTR